jgi:nardilysin
MGAPVITSPADKREYRALQLPNGLKVLLIYDPEIVDTPEHDEDGHRSERSDENLEIVITDDEDLDSLLSDGSGSDEVSNSIL